MKKQVVIIGAGISGLVTAKALKEYGYDVIVLEKENGIGGVWASSRHYPGLTTQNTKDTYHFSDLSMPIHYPEFPTGKQMLQYLSDYAETFDLWPHIMLNKKVTGVKYDAPNNNKLWEIAVDDEGETFFIDADFLIVCNGTFSEPFIPYAKGMESFTDTGGIIAHTTQIKDRDAFKDKKLVVVGYGKSACDVAAALSKEAKELYMVYKEPKWKVPKKIKGINYKYFILTRFGEALTKFDYRTKGEKFLHFTGLPKLALGSFQKTFSKQQNLKKAKLQPTLKIRDLLVGELSVESDHFFSQVIDGKIKTVQSEINHFTHDSIILKNGQIINADAVLYGTGFIQQLNFLPEEIIEKITDREGNYILYRNILPVNIPGLAFNGYNASFFCTLTSEIAAYWISEYLNKNIRLPSEEVMLQTINEFIQKRKQNRKNALCKGASVWPFNLTYVDWLLKDMNTKLPFKSMVSEWLKLVNPAHYAPVLKSLRKKRSKDHTMEVKL